MPEFSQGCRAVVATTAKATARVAVAGAITSVMGSSFAVRGNAASRPIVLPIDGPRAVVVGMPLIEGERCTHGGSFGSSASSSARLKGRLSTLPSSEVALVARGVVWTRHHDVVASIAFVGAAGVLQPRLRRGRARCVALAAAARRTRAPRLPKEIQVEPFQFEADLDDHCETPSIAYKHVTSLLRDIAQRLRPEIGWEDAAAQLRIYDPYYCQGGTTRRLEKLGFKTVHNKNEDFYAVAASSRGPPEFDVLITNPPFTDKEHLPFVLRFALESGKPWLMILPMYAIFSDAYAEAFKSSSASDPLFVVPGKKYNFKTPAPLPAPPKQHARPARTRSRLVHTIWVVHPGREAAVVEEERSSRGDATNGASRTGDMDDAVVQTSLREGVLEVARRTAESVDIVVATSCRDIPRHLLPSKFTEEMRRNAERFGVALPED